MPRATRRTVLTTAPALATAAPALAANGGAAAPARISEVAAAYAALEPYLGNARCPREEDFVTVAGDWSLEDVDKVAFEAACAEWHRASDAAWQRLVTARATSHADAALKVRAAIGLMNESKLLTDLEDDPEAVLLRSCLRDLQTMQVG